VEIRSDNTAHLAVLEAGGAAVLALGMTLAVAAGAPGVLSLVGLCAAGGLLGAMVLHRNPLPGLANVGAGTVAVAAGVAVALLFTDSALLRLLVAVAVPAGAATAALLPRLRGARPSLSIRPYGRF